jgi:hypothetical protein
MEFMRPDGCDVSSNDSDIMENNHKWVQMHKGVVMTCLNEIRSYVVSRMREVCYEHLDDPKIDALPTLDEITSIVHRLEESNVDTFCWWWDKFLPAATGNSVHWGPNIRHYEIISSALIDEKPGCLHMPVSTEAFAYLTFKHCWPFPGKKLKILPKKPPNHKEAKDTLYLFTDEDTGLDVKITQVR